MVLKVAGRNMLTFVFSFRATRTNRLVEYLGAMRCRTQSALLIEIEHVVVNVTAAEPFDHALRQCEWGIGLVGVDGSLLEPVCSGVNHRRLEVAQQSTVLVMGSMSRKAVVL